MAELKKTLGFWMVASIAFLNLVNTGIFFGAKIGAEAGAGNAIAGIDSLIAWVVLAILSIYIAMCFAELTSMFPAAGGVYEFAKQAYGRFPSFLIAWVVWVAGNIATALFTVAAIKYLFPALAWDFLGMHFGPTMTTIILSISIVLILNYIAYRGIEASAKFMISLSLFMMLVIGFVIVKGASGVQASNLSGFTFHTSLILLAVFFLSETFFGWESASYMSEETEDAEHTIPKALVMTTTIVAIAAVLITVVIIGVLGIPRLLDPTTTKPIIDVLAQVGVGATLLTIVNIGIVAALLGNVSGNVVGLPRLLLAMSRDKLFIEQFSDIHPKRQTPYKAIILQTIVATLVIILAAGAYENLLELLVPVSLVMYASIIILVPYFRITRPDQKRPYKAPFGRVLPFIVVLFFLTLLSIWVMSEPSAVGQLRLLFSFVFFSIPIYLLLTYFYDPDSLIGTMNFFSRLNLWLENFLIPKSLRREVIAFFNNSKDKHVLEFGSGVGTLTLHLAEHVGKNGHVYAISLSPSDIKILQRRMTKLGHTHVEVICDPHLVNRIHPAVKSVDMIASIGHLSYIQDVKKVLKEMNAILPQSGQIYFVEYIDLFYFLPNPKWLSDPDEIRKVFAEAGFTVTVRVRRGLFWNYLYIYGIKGSKNVPYI